MAHHEASRTDEPVKQKKIPKKAYEAELSRLQTGGVVLAVVSTGVLCGAAHVLVVAFPILAFFGIANGVLRVRTDSIYPPIVLHAAFNGIALIAAVSGA